MQKKLQKRFFSANRLRTGTDGLERVIELEEESKKTWHRELFSWAKWILGAVIIAFMINQFVIANATIMSGSMEDTIMTGDRVFCNRLAYIGNSPERYDIIVFKSPFEGEDINYFKRVIGLPGETIMIMNGLVYVNYNAQPLDSSFLRNSPQGNFGPYIVPQNHYFVLGDNRNHSNDSRYWQEPYIPRELILGKAVFRYYPNPSIIKSQPEA